MRRAHSFTHIVVSVVLALVLAGPVSVRAAEGLGQHVVQAGDTLYCLGRGYGVLPGAIASANGLSMTARLSVGQVLTIPAVQWSPIPAGPVCATQFQSPYTSSAPAAVVVPQVTPTPAPQVTPAPVTSQTTSGAYIVRRGDTLWRIGQMFGVTVNAIKAANNLISNIIYPGQVLIIPGMSGAVVLGGAICDPSYPTVCIPPSPPDLDCINIQHRNFQVLAPDPHHFDDNRDGVGCEQPGSQSIAPNCDPSYPDVCIPPYPPDLNCPDISPRSFRVLPPDPHNFDGNRDGVGCEL